MKVSSFKNKDKEDENINVIETLLELTKETVKVYNEGGIPLKGSKFEDFTISHFPEILNNLRK
jgi:hypothetical protein